MRAFWFLPLVLAVPAWAAWDRGAAPEVFTSVPAEFRRNAAKFDKVRIVVDCGPEAVTIWPGGTVVSARELLLPDHPVRKQVDQIAADPRTSYLVVLQRPGSAKMFLSVYRTFYLKRIEVAHELIDAGAAVETWMQRPGFVLGELARPRDKRPVLFECRSNGVFYVSHRELAHEVARFVDRYRPLSRREDIAAMDAGLARQKFADEHYEVETKAISIGKLRLRIRPDATGETVAEIVAEKSKLRARLKELDRRQQYVRLMVRDDSFESARQAREVVEQAGFEWRLQVLEGEEPLEFAQ